MTNGGTSGNGSQDIQATFSSLLNRVGATTGCLANIWHRLINIGFIEMEDVLFHLNSCVMMPARPEGKSSTQGDEDDDTDPGDTERGEAQAAVSGLSAIALAFKQFEFDAGTTLLIAGHTDTSGGAKMNFELSELRALNVLLLMEGNRRDWALGAAERHRIEDYQQIMKWIKHNTRWGWDCDPDKVDNIWGDKTSGATQRFIDAYNDWVDSGDAPDVAAKIAPDMHSRIRNDGQHKWPMEMWQAVFDVYNDELAAILRVDRDGLNGQYRTKLHWANDEKKYVSCGESFPIDDAERDNYRSQQNRRVELLFFDEGDAPPVINCPGHRDTVHTAEECPIWHHLHYIPVYIDPNDLNAVGYHLKFVYFDRVYQALKPVPEGLQIKVFENGTDEINARLSYSNGVYLVKVQQDDSRTDLQFTFETANKWIYSADSSTDPVIVEKTPAEIAAMPFIERIKYYDLPTGWSSRNYWTRYDGNMNTGGIFREVMENTKQYKPFGGNVTSSNAPMIFSLDDIVLCANNRSQVIRDQNSAGASFPAANPLNNNSRYTLFHLDYSTNESYGSENKNLRKLKIHNPDPNLPQTTNTQFTRNHITDVPGNARLVYFCNGFYDVFDKRTTTGDTGFNFASGHVAGARMALLNDSDIHVTEHLIGSNAANVTAGFCFNNVGGNYDLHYLHNCGDLDGKPLEYLLIHWSGRIQADTTAGTTVTANDVTNHRNPGFANANERMNRKNYLFVKDSGGNDIIIRPHWFMEYKNNTNGGQHKALITVVDSGSWMLPATAHFRKAAYQTEPNRFGAHDPDNTRQDTNGQTNEPLANCHEMGHALGNGDEYLYSASDSAGASWGGVPAYAQPNTPEGGPYSGDTLALMNRNRAWRMRHLWKFVCWLHDRSAAGSTLHPFFHGTRFKITLPTTSGSPHNYRLPEASRNIFLPTRKGTNIDTGDDSKVDLMLFRLGDEEYARLIKSGITFNGILAVRTKFAVKFINGSGAANQWTTARKRSWVQALNNDYKNMCNGNGGKFRLEASGANDFKNVFAWFAPHFKEYTGGAPGDSHINVEVTYDTGGDFSSSGNELDVKRDVNNARIIRYCWGLDSGTGNLTKDNFTAIEGWMARADVANGTFDMKNL